MNEKEGLFEALTERAEEYIKARIELLKLQAVEKVTNVSSLLAGSIIIIFVVSVFLIALNLGLAFWLGDILGHDYYGFFILAGIYGLIALLLYINRIRWINKPLAQKIISELLK